MSKVRVRFAPSPTGPLHIGGVRTALYNYLYAKSKGGDFLLRVEDTDQTRYVAGAEDYIIRSLEWLGLTPDEGPTTGGNFGPYRQSERKDLYKKYALQMVEQGNAYYAFDSAEELDAERQKDPNFKYGYMTRKGLKNSLTLSDEETQKLIEEGSNVVIRLNMPEDRDVQIHDEIRGEVTLNTRQLDDKVILKGDGMPTYHLANIVDDHLMEISHVIRGEEWLSSTAHHVLMYEFMGWTAPTFAHLPLILKPTGKGKLSKRDGAKFGFPVFPLNWDDAEEPYPGFKEEGYLPEALLNFLAFLGWNPGDDTEMYTLEELVKVFSLEKIVKSGARFDLDKAKWYNQQYIIAKSNEDLANLIRPQIETKGYNVSSEKLAYACGMMKERVDQIDDIVVQGYYLFDKPTDIDSKTFNKKYKPENEKHFHVIADLAEEVGSGSREDFETKIKGYIMDNELKMGQIMPILRIALTGTMKGPDLFDTFAFLGGQESKQRIIELID